MKKLVILIFTLIMAASVNAKSLKSSKIFNFTGNMLSEFCVDGFAKHRGICMGYITGVAAVQKSACIPDGVKWGQVKKVAIKYIAENPEIAHKNAFEIVVSSLKNAWPCK